MPLFNQAFESLVEEDPVNATQTLHGIASSLFHCGEYALAAEYHRIVLEARELFLPPDHPDLATSLHNLAGALLMLGEVAEAAMLEEKALDRFRAIHGDDHAYVLDALIQYADAQHRLGEYEKAEPIYRRALELWHVTNAGEEAGAQELRTRLQSCAARQPLPPLSKPAAAETVDPLQQLTQGVDVETARHYGRCVRAFLARDYAMSAEVALAVSQQTQRHDIMQMLAISLLRLGEKETANAVLDWAMEIAAGSPYEALLALTAGRTHFDAAMSVASNSRLENHCELFYAYRCALDGDRAIAAELWQRVATRTSRSFEGMLARVEWLLREVPVDRDAHPGAEQLEGYKRKVAALRIRQAAEFRRRQISSLAERGELERAVEGARLLSEDLAKRGPELADECATALNLAAHLLFTHERYEESLPYYEETLRILRANAGHPVLVAAAMNNLGNLYTQLGRHREAIRLQQEALADRRSATGGSDPSVLLSLLDLARVYRQAGKLHEAAAQYRAALEVATNGLMELGSFVRRLQVGVKRALGTDDLETAAGALGNALYIWETSEATTTAASAKPAALVEYAKVLFECGRQAEAEKRLQEALRQLSPASSADRVLAARCLCNLGRMLPESRREESLAYLQQALEWYGTEQSGSLRIEILVGLAERNRGTQSEVFAQKAIEAAQRENEPSFEAAAWHALGTQQEWEGKIQEAIESYQRALELRPEDAASDRCHDLHRLAELALALGRFDEAQARVLEMQTLAEGPLPVPRATKCLGLQFRGRIAMRQRKQAEALTFLRQALKRQTEDVPENIDMRVAILLELGPTYLACERTHEGIAALEEAMERLAALSGDYELQAGFALSQLAAGKYSLGDLATAGDLIRQAMEKLESLPDENPRILAGAWRTAGQINLSAGAHKTALRQLERARDLFVTELEAEAGVVAAIDLDLATLKQVDGQWEESLVLAEQAQKRLAEEGEATAAACRLKAQALAALRRRAEALEKAEEALYGARREFRRGALALSDRQRQEAGSLAQRALDLLLTLALDLPGTCAERVLAAVQAWRTQEPEILAARHRVARETQWEKPGVPWRMIDELQNLIGRTLLQKPNEPLSTAEQEQVRAWEARVRELEEDLFGGEVNSFELAEEWKIDVKAIGAKLAPGEMLLHYVRHYVVPFDNVTMSPFGDGRKARYMALALFAESQTASVQVELFEVGEASEIDSKVEAFHEAITTMNESQRDLGEFLRQRLLEPVLPELRAPSALRIVAEGALATLPFDALPWQDGFLLDLAQISYLDAGRERLRFETPLLGRSNPSVVIAAPNFDLTLRAEVADQQMEPGAFSPLEGAGQEGAAIAEQLGVRPLLGDEAVESAVRAMHSPQILHLATHGFYIPKARYEGRSDVFDTVRILDVPGEGQFVVGATREEAIDDPFSMIHRSRLENPLVRSGLVFAGANAWMRGEKLPISAEDSVMTALEVAGLDLSNTELVVLSACETGLGVADEGETPLGLRTAFQAAGARSVVVSFWPVTDRATAQLMEEFYRHLLLGQPRAEALRQAKLKLRAGEFAEPVFWAAFACVGDPGALVGPFDNNQS